MCLEQQKQKSTVMEKYYNKYKKVHDSSFRGPMSDYLQIDKFWLQLKIDL